MPRGECLFVFTARISMLCLKVVGFTASLFRLKRRRFFYFPKEVDAPRGCVRFFDSGDWRL